MVQAALKLVLEPIFETDFEPVSYGFHPAVMERVRARVRDKRVLALVKASGCTTRLASKRSASHRA